MELKELTAKILDLFKVNDTSNLTSSINDAVFNADHEVFDRYLELCPDLEVDWMQRIYQFYCADRKEKKQDYTPVSLSRLVSALTSFLGEGIVYDSCCGSGSLSIQKWVLNNKLSFVCEELDPTVIPILLFNFCIRNISAVVINRNILSGEIMGAYKTIKGKKYAGVQKVMFPELECVHSSISNPPFNLRCDISTDLKDILPEKYTCNYAFVANALSRCEKRCAVILPAGVLSSNAESECRKYYIEKGWLKAAISLPGNMFESTSVCTCILLFDKEKKSKDVMLIDASKMNTIEIRKQRGEGDASHYNRIYEKQFNVFTDKQIYAICALTETESPNYSKLLSLQELSEHRYNLQLGPYIPLDFDDKTLHRDFNAIISDINRVARERNVVKISVNKVWAEGLGLTEVIKDCEKSVEVTKSLNDMLSKFKNYEIQEKLIENKYIQSSNSKVFCIENTDKEILSSIMPFFMNMYKQHLYYLNNEENRLLAELRDALLGPLMSGELELNE